MSALEEGQVKIGCLEEFRDTFVHPQSATAGAEEVFLLQGLHNWVLALNTVFDEGLERVRRTICEHLKDLLDGLPATQQAGCRYCFFNLAMKHWFWIYDLDSLEGLEQLGKDLLDRSGKWRSDLEASKPNERQLDNARKLATCMCNVIPFSPPTESAETDHRLPSFNIRFLDPIAHGIETAKGMWGRLRGKAGRSLESNSGDYLRNLVTVSVLVNEAMNTVGERVKEILDSQQKSGGLTKPLDMPEWQKREVAGLAKVEFALLVGILRDYEKVVQTNDWVAIPEVDNIVGDRVMEASVRSLRNSVFHVSEPEVDPDEMESMVLKQDLPALLPPPPPNGIRFGVAVAGFFFHFHKPLIRHG